ncbi:MAG: NADH:ubiquinone reductase (Na(+)-transporting) subunit F, partial [Planctomycetota bacterium]|nr:NADH:ubiquinone reductase (Na(+)-transporting) subunit F [Planctomycetota bacterium]
QGRRALSDAMPEDNGSGYTGFIHQVLHDNSLKDHPDLDTLEFYMCGPPMMNTAVQNLLDDMGVEKEMVDFDDFGG